MTDVPLGVKIIAVLYWIGAGMAALAGLLLIVSGGAVLTLIGGAFQGWGMVFMALFAILVLGVVLLNVFIGLGLWKCRPWARMVAVILAMLGVLGGLVTLLQGNWAGIVNVLISGPIGGYLLFSSEVKDAF